MISQISGLQGFGVGGRGGGGLGQAVLFTCHLGATSSHDATVPLGRVQSFVLLLSHLPLRNIVRMLEFCLKMVAGLNQKKN